MADREVVVELPTSHPPNDHFALVEAAEEAQPPKSGCSIFSHKFRWLDQIGCSQLGKDDSLAGAPLHVGLRGGCRGRQLDQQVHLEAS